MLLMLPKGFFVEVVIVVFDNSSQACEHTGLVFCDVGLGLFVRFAFD
jgi:hypothetical protein